MSLFKPAGHSQAYLKLAMFGETGTGKSMTASLIAIGLVKLGRERKLPWAERPVLYFDTENGTDYLLDLYAEAGVELQVAKTRTFKDLVAATREAERLASVYVIDSVSACWLELRKSVEVSRGRTNGLKLPDFSLINDQWSERFATPLINLKVHTIICGRSQTIMEHETDEDGKTELRTHGKRIKGQKELGHEMSLLAMLELEQDQKTMRTVRRAKILKDRTRQIDGKEFVQPAFKHFLPHIEKLALGAELQGVDLDKTSQAMIPEIERRDKYPVLIEIVCEEVQGLLVKHFPGQTAAEKQTKVELLFKHFGTRSWKELEANTDLMTLRAGFDSLHRDLEKGPSRYADNPRVGMTIEEEINDTIPALAVSDQEPAAKPRVRVAAGVAPSESAS